MPEGRSGDVEDTARDALIVFTPSGRRGRFPIGTPVLTAARNLGVDIDSVCGGRSICGRCQVMVATGRFTRLGIRSVADHVTPTGAAETRYAERRGLRPERRLSCQACILGDLVVDVPPESQVHRPVVRKRADARAIEIDPIVKLHYVEVEPPDMSAPTADLRRLRRALRQQWNLTDVTADWQVLQDLGKALRDGRQKVTVAVRHGDTMIAAWPGYRGTIYGLAVDIGSTTIAGHLCDLTTGEVVAASGRMNPQIRFGEDVMSRVAYVMMHEGAERELTAIVRQAIGEVAAEVAAAANVATDDILELTVVGNPIMQHLFLGIDPSPLGAAPFALAVDESVDLLARDVDIAAHRGAHIHVLPCIAGHVGADTAAVVLSEGPHLRDETSLIVDIGTNAEIVVGNRRRLLAASSPTGPAFEGAQLTCGQRAAPGAIERVRIDAETLEPRFRVIGSELWSDQAGFADSVERIRVTGLCGSGIIEAIAEMFLAGIIAADGRINGTLAASSPRVYAEGRTHAYRLHDGEPTIVITQSDVRAVQLAKAALFAGARLLMERMGVETVDRIVLAGAFGSHISPKHAMVLGLIPDCLLDRVSSAGNAAGTGARIALVNAAARREIDDVARRIEKVETAVEPRFQAHFVDAMAIPHARAPFPNLRGVVALPLVAGDTAGRQGTRRGRARSARPQTS